MRCGALAGMVIGLPIASVAMTGVAGPELRAEDDGAELPPQPATSTRQASARTGATRGMTRRELRAFTLIPLRGPQRSAAPHRAAAPQGTLSRQSAHNAAIKSAFFPLGGRRRSAALLFSSWRGGPEHEHARSVSWLPASLESRWGSAGPPRPSPSRPKCWAVAPRYV